MILFSTNASIFQYFFLLLFLRSSFLRFKIRDFEDLLDLFQFSLFLPSSLLFFLSSPSKNSRFRKFVMELIIIYWILYIELIDTFLKERFHFPIFLPSPSKNSRFRKFIIELIDDRYFSRGTLPFPVFLPFSLSFFLLSFFSFEKFEISKIYYRINWINWYFSRGTQKRGRFHFPVFLPSPFSEITFSPIRDSRFRRFHFPVFLLFSLFFFLSFEKFEISN